MPPNENFISQNIVREFAGISKKDKTTKGSLVQDIQPIKFELKKAHFIYVHPADILFMISSDHYVKSLIRFGNEIKWLIRHCTLKEMLAFLPPENFIRLNKFYILNCDQFLSFNEQERKFCLKENISVHTTHRISPFIIKMIKK